MMELAQDHRLKEVESMLARRIGVDMKSLDEDRLAQAVRQRMASLGLDNASAYLGRVLAGDEELWELVEQVIVPETWFFRNVQPFRCLRHYVTERWRPHAAGATLRLLSVPCCTGEEPYSMAMTLLDVGLNTTQFHVDGADISRRVLGLAAEGVYGKRSFREEDAESNALEDRYCRPVDDKRSVVDEVRFSVRFLHANVVAPDFLVGQRPYHVIFCRNLLIYLDAAARGRVLANLRRLLSPEGMLYVGHVEAGIVTGHRFETLGYDFPFAFRTVKAGQSTHDVAKNVGEGGRRLFGEKPRAPGLLGDHFSFPQPSPLTRPLVAPTLRGGRGASRSAAATPNSGNHSPAGPGAPLGAQGPPRKRDCPKVSSPAETATGHESTQTHHPPQGARRPDPSCSLDTARQAADEGRLEEAETICTETLTRCPPCADAFCLLGVIRLARGAWDEAEQSFQKALYLDARHHEALVHMMLISQKRGDQRLAANFRRRAERAASGGTDR